MDSVPPTNLIAEFHQLFNTLLVGMVLLSVLEADGVHHQVAVDMLSVNMSCDYTLILPEGFLCKLHCYLVCELRLNFISAGEALHLMIVEPSVSFVVQILSRSHFIECSLG